MVRKSPAFSFYPDSWRGGVALMSPLERAAYIDLICVAWSHGGFTRQQAYRVCCDIDEETVDAVLDAKFEAGKDGIFKNLRLEEERDKQKKRSANGSKGGRPRKLNESKTKANSEANGKLNESKQQSKTKHSVLVSVSDSVLGSGSVSDSVSDQAAHTPSTSVDDAFARFWSVVHVQKGKQDAARAFAKAVKIKTKQMLCQQDAIEFLIDAMEEFSSTAEAHPTERSPILPATWLNSGRYDDDRTLWRRSYEAKTTGQRRIEATQQAIEDFANG